MVIPLATDALQNVKYGRRNLLKGHGFIPEEVAIVLAHRNAIDGEHVWHSMAT